MLLTRPHLTVAEFKAAPTYLDLNDLIVGGTAGQQDHALENLLLRASSWCDDECNQPLAAHTSTERTRASCDRDGRFVLHPPENPVRSITAFAYGADPARLTTVASPSVWIEGGVQVIVTPSSGAGGAWSGALQLGGPVPGRPVFVSYTYVAGYVSTVLAADVSAGASSVLVADPTGIVAGDTLRLWEPGVEEAFVVAAGYVTGSTTVPLTAPLTYAHTAGVGSLSGLPADLKQAVIEVACSKLVGRKLAGGQQIAGALLQPTTTANGASSGGQRSRRISASDLLLAAAMQTLKSYKRVR